MSALDALYREIILDHYKSPRNRGRIDDPTIATQGNNPLCGDEIEVSLLIDQGRVADVRFQGVGCSISQASASMMTDSVKGKSIAEVLGLIQAFKDMMSAAAEPDPDTLGELEALAGVRQYPVRVKCASLAWTTLLEALDLLARAPSNA
ncbi:MAG: SUF system NifU family Fe-S cluster assembly protein [Chloroflexi bacterium]|nr:SUF system NifU family Fe-S cluster assembly protein [Chloroflexota bacterium]